MTKALAATQDTQDLLSATKTEATTSEDVENLLQSYKNEVHELRTQQNQPEYIQAKLIEALAENQIRLQKNQEIIQQQITIPSEPPENDFGSILSIVPLIISVIAFALAIFALWRRGNTQAKRLGEKQKQIDDLKSQVESLSREIKLLKATRPVQNSFDNPAPARQAPQNNFAVENYQPATPPLTPSLLKKSPAPVVPSPRNLREEKEKAFIKDFNRLLAESKTSNFRTARAEFTRKYSIKAFSCANYDERMKNPSLAPEFVSESSTAKGDFWAYKVDNVYLVVPSPANSSYNDNLHLERAMSEVFDSNFIQGKTYDEISVEQAAIFLEGFKKEKKGTLKLS